MGWKRLVTALSCLAVFCTTYALIIPAITMEREVFCGMEEHAEHTAECEKTVKICTFGTENDLVGDKVLICDAESLIESNQLLICTAAEHVHDASCLDEGGNLICELTEHTHSAECYAEVGALVCSDTEHLHTLECYAEKQVHEHTDECWHTHSDECFENAYACGMPIHVHSLQCYSNSSLTESSTHWEMSMQGVTLSGTWAEDLAAIAESQLGYTESDKNYLAFSDGSINGYTRYGDWYGAPYEDWCAMFVSFCVNYARINMSIVPAENRSSAMYSRLTAGGMLKDNTHSPERGNLVFFDFDGDTVPERVGIVSGYDEGSGLITVVEGDFNGTVAKCSYEAASDCISGYGVLPEKNDSDQPVVPVTRLNPVSDGTEEQTDDMLNLMLPVTMLGAPADDAAGDKAEEEDGNSGDEADKPQGDEDKSDDKSEDDEDSEEEEIPELLLGAPPAEYTVTISVTSLDGDASALWSFSLTAKDASDVEIPELERSFTLSSGQEYVLDQQVASGTKITVHQTRLNGYSTTVKEDGVCVSDSNTVADFVVTKDTKLEFYNNPGVLLPSTGGIGTTVFYIAAGMLFVFAVMLYTAKKPAEEN